MSAIPAPRSVLGLSLLGLVLVDVPVFAAIVVCGVFFGFHRTYDQVMEWRLQHPWSLLPSLLLTVLLVRRWRRR